MNSHRGLWLGASLAVLVAGCTVPDDAEVRPPPPVENPPYESSETPLPSPIPAPDPVTWPAQLSIEQTAALAWAAGFSCADGTLANAIAIAIAESSLRPSATNEHPEYGHREDGTVHHDRGLWQISSYWWPSVSDAEAFDPQLAAIAAFELYGEGGFELWDTWDNGAAQRHIVEAWRGWPAVGPVVAQWCADAAAD